MRPYYDDGTCVIYHADCRDFCVAGHPQMFFDVLVTDPPYGIAYESGHFGTLDRSILGDEDTSVRDHILRWWGDGPALVFGSWRAERPMGTRQLLVWDTGGANGMGALDLPWKPSHQEIYVLGRGFNGPRTSDVLRYSPVQSMAANGRVHPHEKPLSLMRALVAKCPDGAILDPFAGSGTTLRAAKDLGRRSVGIEFDERYCEIAANRLAQEVLALT